MPVSFSTVFEVDLKIPTCISTNVKRRNKQLFLSITPPISKKVRINEKDISTEVSSIDICLSVPINREQEAAKLAKDSRQSGITVEYFDFYKNMPVELNQDSIDIDFSFDPYIYELALIGQGGEKVYLPIVSMSINAHDNNYLDLFGFTQNKLIY